MQSDDQHEKAPKPDPTSSLESATPERRSLLGRFGGPSNPGGVLSKPTGPIMADPAWVFEERPTTAAGAAEQTPLADDRGAARHDTLSKQALTDVIADLNTEVEAARVRNARQTAQESPGDSAADKERAKLSQKWLGRWWPL